MEPVPREDDQHAQPCAIGLDVGGTKMAGAVVTHLGAVMTHETLPTQSERGPRAVVDDAFRLVERLMRQAVVQARRPAAIGIGVCELVDLEGNIVSDQTIAWRGWPIRDEFRALAPTFIEADSRAAALAEARFGAGKLFPTFLYVTIGTGIGSSLVIDGKPYCGARGSAGTLASGPISSLCSECGKLSQSVLEDTASGTAIAARYAKLTENRETINQSDSRFRAEDINAAADHGDAIARHVLETAGRCVGSLISLMVNMLDPHAVVIGGGLGTATGIYWESLQSTAREQIWSDTNRDLPIVRGALGPLAGAIGAATYALERLLAQDDSGATGSASAWEEQF
jgi:glucokinase